MVFWKVFDEGKEEHLVCLNLCLHLTVRVVGGLEIWLKHMVILGNRWGRFLIEIRRGLGFGRSFGFGRHLKTFLFFTYIGSQTIIIYSSPQCSFFFRNGNLGIWVYARVLYGIYFGYLKFSTLMSQPVGKATHRTF